MIDPLRPVLIVDSDPSLRRELIETLTRVGQTRIVVAGSAFEAFRRLDDCRPSSALVEWGLKRTGGLCAAVQLMARAEALGFRLPVILIAPHGGEGMALAAKGVGASGVVAWPQDRQILVAAVIVVAA